MPQRLQRSIGYIHDKEAHGILWDLSTRFAGRNTDTEAEMVCRFRTHLATVKRILYPEIFKIVNVSKDEPKVHLYPEWKIQTWVSRERSFVDMTVDGPGHILSKEIKPNTEVYVCLTARVPHALDVPYSAIKNGHTYTG